MPLPANIFYKKKRKASPIIPPPGNVSEDDVSDSGDEDYIPIAEPLLNNSDSSESEESGSDSDNEVDLNPQPGTSTGSSTGTHSINNQHGNRKANWKKYLWTSGDHSIVDRSLINVQYTIPEKVFDSAHYFSTLFGDIIAMIVEQTNLYSVQCTGTSINTNVMEMKTFLGMLIKMGVYNFSAYRDYWCQESRLDDVAGHMGLKRFEKIRRYIHFTDNTTINPEDRYAKIRPLLDAVKNNIVKIEPELDYSVDEAMIPYKGQRAGNLRQYVKNKPKKWGFKFFVRAGVSGIVYDFLPYAGSSTFVNVHLEEEEHGLSKSAQFVTVLCKTIPSGLPSAVFLDNFFCSLELMEYLKSKKFETLGTVRSDRLRNCKLKNEKDLKKEGRGSYDVQTDRRLGLTVVRWVDNKVVTLASTFMGVQPLSTSKRYDKKEKAKVDVPTPAVVKNYNKHMGGVDLGDMLISLYRTPFKAKRYYLRIFAHMLDLCICNAWLLARRDANLLQEQFKKPLKKFRQEIATSLLLKNRVTKRGRPSHENAPISKIRRPVALRPQEDVRFDQTAHWPIHASKGRCRNCTSGWSRMKCSKCKVILCWTAERNCFLDFHTN